MKKIIIALVFAATGARAQQTTPLTVEKIMRDQKWLGTSPSDYRWSADSKTVYFSWNPENKVLGQLYQAAVAAGKPVKADSIAADRDIMPDYTYNIAHTLGLAVQSGDLYWYDVKTNKKHRLTNTTAQESEPVFLTNGNIAFQKEENVFTIDLKTNELKQLTNFVEGKKPEDQQLNVQDTWLKNQQNELFDVIKNKKKTTARNFGGPGQLVPQKPLKPLYLDDQSLSDVVISPDGRYVSYQLVSKSAAHKSTTIPRFVTASGYTEDIQGRTKVGTPLPKAESFIYDQQKDTVYQVHTAQIPGIKDLPDFLKDYPKELELAKTKNADRQVDLSGPIWNGG